MNKEGVWAILDRDHYETIAAVYPSELEALRAVNWRGCGRVVPLAWGETIGGELA